MKKGILLIAVVLLGIAGVALAAETKPSTDTQLDTQANKLSVTFEVKYLSRYIWRGFDSYPNDHSAIQPSIDVDLFGTGLGVKVFHSRANRSGFEDNKEIDTTLYYKNGLFDKEAYAIKYTVGWTYYNFPDNPRKGTPKGWGDMQEAFAGFAFPNICPLGIIPSYTAVLMWPAVSDSYGSDNGGWAHIFGLDYALTVPGYRPDTPEQVINLHAETVYNDGVGPAGESVDHDWSHALFGISTDFTIFKNLIFTPAVYYQSSWDDSVNPNDETWVSLSAKYKF